MKFKKYYSSFNETVLEQKYSGIYLSRKGETKDLVMIGPIITISCEGKIIEANKDYEYCDSNAIGNIHEESFYSMLKKLQMKKNLNYAEQ